MKLVPYQSVRVLRASMFSLLLATAGVSVGCADAGPDEESEETTDAEGELEEGEDSADPQAQIITGVKRDNNPRGTRSSGKPSVSVTRNSGSRSSGGSGTVTRTTPRSSGSSSSVGRTVSTGSSGRSTTVTRTVR